MAALGCIGDGPAALCVPAIRTATLRESLAPSFADGPCAPGLFRRRTSRLLKKLPFPDVALSGRFEDVIATLKTARLYITGQYHGVYSCGLAGTPFVCFPSNSRKIEALLTWSKLPIPICKAKRDLEQQMKAAVSNPGVFQDFREFLLSQRRHTKTFIDEHLGETAGADE